MNDVICIRCGEFLGREIDICPICGKSQIGDSQEDIEDYE